jgi:hypothetical protein
MALLYGAMVCIFGLNFIENSMTHFPPSNCKENGFTTQQWIVLVLSFFLGIVAVLTVDKFILTVSAPAGTVQAAISPYTPDL